MTNDQTKVGNGRFSVEHEPDYPGSYLVTFGQADRELKKWASDLRLETWLDNPEDGNPVRWMVRCDMRRLTLLKLSFGGAA